LWKAIQYAAGDRGMGCDKPADGLQQHGGIRRRENPIRLAGNPKGNHCERQEEAKEQP
jgi:hypothetical protein